MTSAKSIKYAPPVEIDPNFFIPPNVVDMRYIDLESQDSATDRDDDGEIVNVDYEDSSYSGLDGDSDDSGPSSSVISPPDDITVISQTVRVTQDGKFVVDVVLDVETIPGVVNYNVKVNKA